MIRKLLCWLGLHYWIYHNPTDKTPFCKYCGTLKRENDTQNNLRITDE